MVYTPYIWWLVASAVLLASIAVYASKYRDAPALRPFALTMWFGSAWAFLYGASIVTVWYPARVALSMLMYVPTRLIAPAILAFAIEYTGREKWLSRRNVAIGLLIPALAIAASLTSPWHHLFRFDFRLDRSGPLPVLFYSHGILYTVSSWYQDLLILSGLGLLLISLRDRALEAKSTILLFVGIFVPILTETLFDLGVTPIAGYNFAPSTIVVTAASYFLALLRYRLFSFAPIARSKVFENIADIALVVDTHSRILDFNGAAQTALRLDPVRARGACLDRLPPAWREVFESVGGDSTAEKRQEISMPHEGSIRTFDLSITHVRDSRGKVVGSILLLHDITELRVSEERIRELLKEKELLIREVHHRIKNNMSVISSLLSLQSETVSDSCARQALQDARSRVHSMMVLYDRLYRSDGTGELSIADYLNSLISQVASTVQVSHNVKIEKEIEDMVVGVRTLFSLGIIVNELITNALKHAFPDGETGAVRVGVKRRGDGILVWVEDDGGRFPEDTAGVLAKGFGLQMVQLMAQQIGAELALETGSRTRFSLEFEP